jgi:hypothetical protein
VKSRMFVLIAAIGVGAALASNASSAPGSGTLYGTDSSSLFAIDPTTGVGTIIGPMTPRPPFGFTSLATDSMGTMYAVGGFLGNLGGVTSSLFTVDPGSGQTVAVGGLGSGGSDYAPENFLGMDFFGGRLLAAQNDDYWPGADRLVGIDPAAAAASAIGPFGNCTAGPIDPERRQCSIEGMDALAFDASGTLYGAVGFQHQWWPDWPSGALIPAGAPGLYKIDPASGASSCNTWPFPSCFFHVPIVDASGAPPAGGVASLQFACDQRLYGGTGDGRLVAIDPLTGSFAYVGSTSATGGSPLLDLAFERSSCLAPPPTEVLVDINPGSTKNRINPSSRGVVPVAILTTDSFDATTVDAGTVCFGDDDQPSQRACTEAHGKSHLEDVNGDGRPDLLLHYRIDQTGIDPGDTTACLTGSSLVGVGIEGCDSITTLPRHHPRCDRGTGEVESRHRGRPLGHHRPPCWER